MEDKEFRDAVFALLQPHLESLLGSKEVTTDDRVRYGDLFTEEENEIIGSGDEPMKKIPQKVKKTK